MFLPPSARGLEISTDWYSAPLSARGLEFFFFEDFITSSLFHTRSKAMFPSSSARGSGFPMNWCSAPLPHEGVPADFITSFLFRTRFEVIFLSSSARGLEGFRSSSVWGSKISFVQRCFYSLPLKVWNTSWFTDTSVLLRSRFEADPWFTDSFALLDPHLKASQTWFCSGLTLESQSNLVLFWSYTWKLVKLGSVLVLHLKADQTWFCFGLTLENRSNL